MKRFFVFMCCVAVLMSCFLLTAAAESPDSGTVSSSPLNYFTGIVNKLPANSDYVIYRSGDYSTTLVYGFDFSFSDSAIKSPGECTQLIYNTRGSGSGTSYTPTLTTNTYSSFTLSYDDTSLIYSNLGHFPSVGDTSKDNLSYILWAIVFLILLFVVLNFFRNRRKYIDL